jgi:hypothetical protein
LSARFTYVSPAATVNDAQGNLWGRLVDGGYFENSGAATAAELIRSVCQRTGAQREWRCGSDVPGLRPFPVVILIKNDPQAPSVCAHDSEAKSAPTRLLSEVRAPVDALLATREARGRYAESQILREVGSNDPALAEHCADGCVLEFALATPPAIAKGSEADAKVTKVRYADPPLGWSLSAESQSAMNQRLGDADIQAALTCVYQLIARGQCTKAPQCAQCDAGSGSCSASAAWPRRRNAHSRSRFAARAHRSPRA